MSIKITNKDVIWGYLGIIMSLGSNLFILPLILNRLSGEELGLWYTFVAVGNIAALFDFGFKPTIARNITYCWCGAKKLNKIGISDIEMKKPNFKLFYKVLMACKKIYFLISFVAAVFLLTIGSIYVFYITRGIENTEANKAWVIYVIAVFLNLYYGYFSASLNGVGAIAEMNKATVIARGIQLIISIILLYLGYGIISTSLAYLIFGLVYRETSKKYFLKYENISQSLQLHKAKVSNKELKDIFLTIWHNAWRDGLVSFSMYLTSQVNTLLCSLFLSLSETGTYGLSLQLIGAIASIAATYFSIVQPRLQATSIEKDINETKKNLSTAIITFWVLYILGIIALLVVGIPFIDLIKSETKIEYSILLVISIYTLLYKNHILFTSYIASTNRILYMKAFLISGLVIINLSIFLLVNTNLRMWALIIPPILIEALYDNWKWPILVMKELKLSLKEMIYLGSMGIKENILIFLRRK